MILLKTEEQISNEIQVIKIKSNFPQKAKKKKNNTSLKTDQSTNASKKQKSAKMVIMEYRSFSKYFGEKLKKFLIRICITHTSRKLLSNFNLCCFCVFKVK